MGKVSAGCLDQSKQTKNRQCEQEPALTRIVTMMVIVAVRVSCMAVMMVVVSLRHAGSSWGCIFRTL